MSISTNLSNDQDSRRRCKKGDEYEHVEKEECDDHNRTVPIFGCEPSVQEDAGKYAYITCIAVGLCEHSIC